MAVEFTNEFWVAVTFLMIGLVLILLEVFQPGFFIAVPGGALFFGGTIGIFAPEVMFGGAGWILWPVLLGVATVVNLWAYKHWAPPDVKPLTMSIDSLPGEEGEVTVPVSRDHMRGKVRIRGGTWSARSNGPEIPPGRRVRVVRAEGVHVVVEPLEQGIGAGPVEQATAE